MTATATGATARDRQAAAIERWLRYFTVPGQVVELRVIGVQGRKAIGECFADHAALARRAAELDALGATGSYFTLNPLRPEMAGATVSANKADVVWRHWLPVDVDPERPDKASSTDDEKRAAWEVIHRVRELLAAAGVVGAILGDSGNGWHTCYPIDLPADDASQQLVKAVLAGLGERCDAEGAKVDRRNHDAPRIWKLYGTRARKGPDQVDEIVDPATGVVHPPRPHRWARLIEDPALGAPQAWDLGTARANTAALVALVERWRREEEMRKGRPAHENGVPAAERARRYVAKMPSAVSGQNGHGQTFEVAQVLARGFGLPRIESWPILLDYNARCVPPWSERELLHKIESAENQSHLPMGYLLAAGAPVEPPANGNGVHVGPKPTAAAKPTVEPETWQKPIPLHAPPAVPLFPLDVLPSPVRGYVEELAWSCNAPVDFAAIPALAAIAGAIGNTCRLAVTRSHHQSACLFAAAIGRPGTGKSTPLDHALAPLEQAERRYFLAWEAAKRDWEQEPHETRGPRPPLRRCLLDDTTTEAIVRVLAENGRGLLMARDELSALVTGMNQYKDGGKGSDRQTYLKLWSGGTIKVDRKSQEGIPLTVRRPFMAIVGGIQPQVIEWLRGEQKGDRPPPDDGFLDRFLVSYPAELPATGEQWREVSEEASRNWADVVDGLLSLEMRAAENGDRLPRLMPLTQEAKLAWARHTQAHADEVNAEDFHEWLRGPWAKMVPGYAGRLALVVQLLRWVVGCAAEQVVDATSVEAAFTLVNYFKGHARKVYQAMGADPRAAEAARILSWLGRHREVTEFSRRDLHRHLANSFDSPESLDAPLWRLVDHGYLRPIDAPERKGPGRKASARYEINPLWERRKIDLIDKMGGESSILSD